MKSWITIAGCSVATMMLLTAYGDQKPDEMNAKTATPTAVEKAATALPLPNKPVTPFSPEMSQEFMRKVMETSARIEAAKQEIADRQAVIFESNPAVKAYKTQLIEMQNEINRILAGDAELAALKLNRDILWTTMPTLPRARPQGGSMHGFTPIK